MHHVSSSFQVARGKAAPLRAARPVLLFAAAYVAAWSYLFIAAFLGAKPPPAPLFPPGAVLLCALLLSPPRHWWRFLAAALLIQVPILAYLHLPPVWNVLGFIPDAIEPIVAVILILRFLPLPLRFASLREVSVYTACVATAVLVAATLGSAVNAGVGGEPYWTTWVGWYLSDILACLVLAPTLLLWIAAGAAGIRGLRAGSRPGSRQRYIEATLLCGGLLLMGMVVFNTRLLGPDTAHTLIYLPVPLLMWAAIRFGSRGIASALSLIVVLAVPAVADARGPFASQSIPAAALLGNVFTLQVFLLVIGVPLFFLAALMQEHRETKATLQESEARFRTMADQAPVLIWMAGPDTLCTFFNTVWLAFTGRSLEHERGKGWAEGVHPDDLAHCMQTHLTAFAARQSSTMEYRLRRFDGEYRWLIDNSVPRFAPDGSFVGYIGSAVDITERKRAEEALRASEIRYRTVVRSLPNTAVLLFDAQLRHTFADGTGLQSLGLTPERLEGRTVWEALPDELAAALAPHYEAARSGQGADLDVEYAQQIYRIQVVSMPISSAPDSAMDSASALAPTTEDAAAPAQTPVGMVVLRDITEQRRARDELVGERTRAAALGALSHEFRTLAEHSPDFIGRLDPSRHLVYLNPAGADLVGLPAEQCIGKTFAELGMSHDTQDVYTPWSQDFREVLTRGAPRTSDAGVQSPRQAAGSQVRSLHTRFIPELADDGTLQSVLVIATDISALKRAEARLAEQADELETIFESQADGVGVYDLQGRFLRANRALRDLLGLAADAEYSTLSFEERAQRLLLYNEQGQPIPLEQWPQWRVLRGEILAGASAMETGVRTLDGRELWISITGAPMRAPDGQATGVVLIARDVTARRALERQVAEQAAELEAIFDAQADGVLVYDRDGHVVRTNRAWQDVFRSFSDLSGLSSEPGFAALPFAEQVDRWAEFERSNKYQLLNAHGHEIPWEETPSYRALRGETVTGANAIDERVEGPAGQVYEASVSAAPIRDRAGTIVGAVAVARDVTARRALERQVAEQAAELEAIFEAIADGVLVHDAQGHVLRVNQAYRELVGLEADPDFLARSPSERRAWMRVVDAQGHPIPTEQSISQRVLRGEVLSGQRAIDVQIHTLDGREVWMSTTGAPIRAPGGHISGAVLIARDVTARRALERQVAEQASELEAIFQAEADGVAVYDLRGRFVRANRALRQLFGFDAVPEFTARPLDERAKQLLLFDEQGQVLTPEQWPHWRVLRGEILAGASAMEGRVRTVDGRELWVSTTGAPVRRPDGQVTGTVLMTRDVSARRALERQAAEQAAEQASAAERTRLAHELHDTVTQEIYSAKLLAESIPRNWPEHRADAEAALAQLPGLIRSALAGLRVLLLELRPNTLEQMPLTALLRQLAEAMSTRAKVPIVVRIQVHDGEGATDGGDGLGPVLPSAVKVVFYRLAQEALMNAVKHAKAHTITVQLRTRGAGTGKGKGRGTSRGGNGTQRTWSRLELAIADDGQGFDPGTAPAGHFGLAIMHERVNAVGATLAVRSRPGQGTQIVAAWRSGRGDRRGDRRAPQAARLAIALHHKAVPHE